MLDLDKNDLMEQIRNQLKPEMTTLFFNKSYPQSYPQVLISL